LSEGGGGLRRPLRDGPHPGGRALPAHPGPAPRHRRHRRCGPVGGGAHGAGARLERRGAQPAGRGLPGPGGAPAAGGRPGRGRRGGPDAPPHRDRWFGGGARARPAAARRRHLMADSRIRFPVDLPDGPRAVRLDVAPAPVPDALLSALAAHLRPDAVVIGDDVPDEAGQDWWPLSAVWATEGLIPARPAAVVRPSDADGVAATIRLAAEYGVPLTPAAGRSGVCGGAVPVAGGVALDLTGLAGIVDVDTTSLRLRVLPGTFGDDLER